MAWLMSGDKGPSKSERKDMSSCQDELFNRGEKAQTHRTTGLFPPAGAQSAPAPSCPGPGGPTGFGKEAVGDLKSEAKGTGARFNAGKVAVDLIPVWIIADWSARTNIFNTYEKREAQMLLEKLGLWQKGAITGIELLAGFDGSWINDCAAVFDYGRKKYAAWNWAKGMQWSVPTGCAVRHLLAIIKGELNDVESGLPHRGHVACNLVMLAQYEVTFKEGDDRPLKWLATSAAPERILLNEDPLLSKVTQVLDVHDKPGRIATFKEKPILR